jgi:hypothetical protein
MVSPGGFLKARCETEADTYSSRSLAASARQIGPAVLRTWQGRLDPHGVEANPLVGSRRCNFRGLTCTLHAVLHFVAVGVLFPSASLPTKTARAIFACFSSQLFFFSMFSLFAGIARVSTNIESAATDRDRSVNVRVLPDARCRRKSRPRPLLQVLLFTCRAASLSISDCTACAAWPANSFCWVAAAA